MIEAASVVNDNQFNSPVSVSTMEKDQVANTKITNLLFGNTLEQAPRGVGMIKSSNYTFNFGYFKFTL